VTVTAKSFWEFHVTNPRVWALFKQFTQELVARGFRHHSADAIYHRIRWETAVAAKTGEFKLNNNYRAWYGHLYNRIYGVDFFRMRAPKDFTAIEASFATYPW
jgi:hypothetical protein